jgi:hypothetical protein
MEDTDMRLAGILTWRKPVSAAALSGSSHFQREHAEGYLSPALVMAKRALLEGRQVEYLEYLCLRD